MLVRASLETKNLVVDAVAGGHAGGSGCAPRVSSNCEDRPRKTKAGS